MRNSLLAATALAFASTTSQAALVSISQIVTNTTTTTQSYDFSATDGLGTLTTPTYMRGSVSVALSDLNRDGATLSSMSYISAPLLYTAWINSVQVQAMPSTLFTLVAPARGGATYTNNFGWEYIKSSLPASTGIEMRLHFTLTPGDQAAVSGTFEVSSVPAPGSIALICSGIATIKRRRKANT